MKPGPFIIRPTSLIMGAIAAMSAAAGPGYWPGSYNEDPWLGIRWGKVRKKRNHNAAKQADAKRARKITRRNRP